MTISDHSSVHRKEVDYYLYNHEKLKQSNKHEDKEWVKVIDGIKEKYPESTEIGKLIKYKYEMKLKELDICLLLHIERATYYSWVNKVINEITLRAAYARLIIPF